MQSYTKFQDAALLALRLIGAAIFLNAAYVKLPLGYRFFHCNCTGLEFPFGGARRLHSSRDLRRGQVVD